MSVNIVDTNPISVIFKRIRCEWNQMSRAPVLENHCEIDKMSLDILSMPAEILDKILSYSSYDEVSRLRLVCRKFDMSAQRILNHGFYKAERFHKECFRKVKEQLPRRESERRKHPLSVHCDILTAIDNRLSLLGMTFMKYVELNYCCFIPGKVLDEVFKILRFVSNLQSSPRAHIILQELRDISSMAMDYFDERIAPAFKARAKPSQNPSVSSYGLLENVVSDDNIEHVAPDYVSGETKFLKISVSVKRNTSKIQSLRRESLAMKRKNAKNTRKMDSLNQKMARLENTVTEQRSRLTNLENRSTEINRKLSQYEAAMTEVHQLLHQLKETQTSHSSSSSSSATYSSDDKLSRVPPSKKRKLSFSEHRRKQRSFSTVVAREDDESD